MSKDAPRETTQKIKVSHEIRRAAFLKKFATAVQNLKASLIDLRAGGTTDEARQAVFFEVNRLVGSFETLGWYREAEIATEIKEKLAPGRAIAKRDIGRLEFLVNELERVGTS